MTRAMLLSACLLAGPTCASASWFTVAGDASQPHADTVQVDPESMARHGPWRTLHIRVNRAQTRHNWHGIPYHSYTAQVRVQCDQRVGEYLNIHMYAEPLWRGAAQERRYTSPRPPLRFKDIEPNPTARIVRAACAAS